MSKLYDVMYPNGQYQDDAGVTKTRWMKVGMIVGTQAGKVALKLDAMPMCPPPNQNGEGGLWLQCFEPNKPEHTANAPLGGGGFRPQPPQNTGQPPQQPQPATGMGQFKDDDVPF